MHEVKVVGRYGEAAVLPWFVDLGGLECGATGHQQQDKEGFSHKSIVFLLNIRR